MVAQIDRQYLRSARGRTLVRAMSYLAFEGRPATTRAQFVNPFVLFHLRAAAAIAGGSPDRPIFLVGMGRSGTTLVGRVLSVHPHVGFLNEPKAMWHVIEPGEDVSGQYGVRGKFVFGADDATGLTADRARALFNWYARVTRSRRIVDKYQELTYRLPFVRSIFPDCKVIAIVRDPVTVAGSVEVWNARHAHGRESWWGVDDAKWRQIEHELLPQLSEEYGPLPSATGDFERAMAEWAVSTAAIVDAGQGGHIDFLLRYETLVRSPGSTFRSLLDAVQLPASERMLEFATSTVDRRGERVGDVVPTAWGEIVSVLNGRVVEGVPRDGS